MYCTLSSLAPFHPPMVHTMCQELCSSTLPRLWPEPREGGFSNILSSIAPSPLSPPSFLATPLAFFKPPDRGSRDSDSLSTKLGAWSRGGWLYIVPKSYDVTVMAPNSLPEPGGVCARLVEIKHVQHVFLAMFRYGTRQSANMPALRNMPRSLGSEAVNGQSTHVRSICIDGIDEYS